MTLRMAVVGGPMYDGLYEHLPFDAELVVHADHPTLNHELATRLAAGERFDLVSTHGKYVPSQRDWLRPLEALIGTDTLDALAPRSLELCCFDGHLLCVPRNIDVRVLWWRTDRMDAPPTTWDEVLASGQPFGFTGRESGLFGLLFELVTAAGGSLFDVDVRPTLDADVVADAVSTIVDLAALGPPELPDWHYDDVDDALLDGRVSMAAAWPGGYGRIRASERYPVLAPAAYPGGRSYSGCHGWAIPTTCADVDAAVAALDWLASAEAQAIDARAGTIPANAAARAGLVPVDDTDDARLAVTGHTIDEAMMTYPPLACFPAIEDAGWSAINDALRGRCTPAEAAAAMQARAVEVIATVAP